MRCRSQIGRSLHVTLPLRCSIRVLPSTRWPPISSHVLPPKSFVVAPQAVAPLFHLPAHRLFAECRFVEVRPAIDVAVPLRSDLLRRDFRIHHRKGCGYLALEVNVDAICCGAQRNAQPLVLRRVDERLRVRNDDRETVRCVIAGVALLIPDSRSNTIRRDSFGRSFLFSPRPTHHAAARGNARAAQPARPRRDLPGVDARPPLVASPFLQNDGMKAARLGRKNGAATSRPPIACGVRSSRSHVSTTHARHVACSGCPYRERAFLAGNRRAGAPAAGRRHAT